MTLEILICTINDGIGGVEKMLLARQEGLRYVVSWQQTDGVAREVPKALCRDDVRVVTMAVGGVSLNRNNAMAHATGDVCVIADDDMTLCADGLRAVVEKFEQDPSLDIATFKYASDCSQKSYPDYEFDLRRFPSGYYVASIEIAFRRASVVGKVLFDDHFGIGAPVLAAGEESVFLHDVLSLGMKGRFFPITIACHNHPTTAERHGVKMEVVMSNGAYLYVAKRHDWMLLRAVLMAWRVSRKGVPFVKALRWVTDGIKYARRVRPQ